MITVYHVPNSRSLRVVWLMEELGEEYRLDKLTIPLSDEFRALAPLGTVPAIEDAEGGQSIRMCESLAILQYITGRRLVAGVEAATNLTVGPRPDPAHYAEHLQWLHFGESDLATPVGTIFRTRFVAREQTNKTIEDQLGQIGRRLALLDKHLADGREWVTGGKFTIADISIGYAFVLAEFMKLEVELPANIASYWQRLQARPAYQRAIAK